jgi:PKD repeat protein
MTDQLLENDRPRHLTERSTRTRRGLVLVTVLALVAGVASVVVASPAAAAVAPPGISPVVQRGPNGVTADALPTVQIDGVVWDQAVVGNTVYAGGQFANARPAGAAPGTSLTPRANLLAYDIRTGNLITSFAPSLNAQVNALAVSPDGSRLYVGGNFTTADGANRYRVAAYNTATGALVSTWAPSLDAAVNAIAVTNNAVYVGGNFSLANNTPRAHLAAFDPVSGALLGWAPTADDLVQALVMSPDNSRVIVGGSFQNVNGSPAYGLASVDAVNGTLYPFLANTIVRDAGTGASILSLSTDGTSIYSTAYVYGTTGNFEGVMSADPYTGDVNWLADCHGDTYGTYANSAAVYVVSHQHFCTNIGGFPDTNPRSRWYRSTAFTPNATGTVQHNSESGAGYGDFGGYPSPSLINWVPALDIGTYTGQSQAAWSVKGNSQYVVEGGEFPRVNGVSQQGLVRFAVPSIATNKQGPLLWGPNMNVAATATSSTTARVSWLTNSDRDDQNLNYTVLRNGTTVYTTHATSWDWNHPTIGFIDAGLTPGQTYTYRVKVTDPNGNGTQGVDTSITMPTASGPSPVGSPFAQDVVNAGASHFWRLDQATGSTSALDYAGFDDLTLSAGVTAGAAGAINGDTDTASTFSGTNTGLGATQNPVQGPDTFTESAWFRTTSTSGGKIVGFGSSKTGQSSNYDRHLYLNSSSQLVFGVYNNANYTITTPTKYNDGAWHQVTGTLSGSGMALYVDGRLIGTNTGTIAGQSYSGYWRVGGDSTWSGSQYLNGSIDDVAIYPTALTLAQVRKQYLDAGYTVPGSSAPGDKYGATVWNDAPSVYYRVDETTGSVATDQSGNVNSGNYAGGFTLGVSSPVTATGSAVTFNGTTGTLASSVLGAAPAVYSEEVWFKTTSTTGGKLIGFGSSRSGSSSTHDRNLYMLGNGKLVFGTKTGTTINAATSSSSYNDGKWHYAAATQGPSGMALYVDGVSVATNSATTATSFNGYWRLGGDSLSGWGADNSFFKGTLDEGAVYPTVLTATQVATHYHASPAATNSPPAAAFTSTVAGATASFDGTGSSDPDGPIVSYSWDYGDGNTDTGATPSHTYGSPGTYNVALTVTDTSGATATVSHPVTIQPNQLPTARFGSAVTNLSVAFDGSGSSDPDGAIAGYSWNFGDGSSSTQMSPTHAYSDAGTYSVTLTVTDDRGGQDSVTHSVVTTLPPNQPPTAAFTANANALSVAFDGTGSSDPDGTIVKYAWDFGDGSSSAQASPSHTYAAPGTYSVTLTVTDNRGGSAFITKSISVSTVVAADAFGRTVSSGWGNADTGGAWTRTGAALNFAVDGSGGLMKLAAAGTQLTQTLNSVSALNVNELVDLSVDQTPTGNGYFGILTARESGSADYRLKVRLMAAGVIHLALSRVVAGKETTLGEVLVKNLTYTAGDVERVRFVVTTNADGSAHLTGTIWKIGTAEPTTPQITTNDATASLHVAGGVAIQSALSSDWTSGATVARFDNLLVSAI